MLRSTLFLICFTTHVCVHAFSPPNSLNMTITYPAGYDTFTVDQLRISGRTDENAKVYVNDQLINVYEHGSFVTCVPLRDHLNQIIVQAFKGAQSDQEILYVYRQPDLETTELEPVMIENQNLKPEANIWAVNGDIISVGFKGSPDAIAQCKIEKMNDPVMMSELPTSQTGGIRGVYYGDIKLQNLPAHRPLDIKYTLQAKNGDKYIATAPGELIVLSDHTPLVGQVRQETLLHTSSDHYSPFTRCPENVNLYVTGRIDDRYKVYLSPTLCVYVSCDDVTLLPAGTPVPHTPISAPQLRVTQNWIELSMAVNRAVPFQLQSKDHPVRVTLTLYGAYKSSHWYRLAQTDIVEHIEFSHPSSHVCECTVTLKQNHLWGYRAFYSNNTLFLRIRRPPRIDAQAPLAGLNIAIDPGHGGSEQGAVSPYGFMEKDINLLWGLQLAETLIDHGANVYLTRSKDSDVSLRNRLKSAREAESMFFISLHNNAVGPGIDPRRVQGTSTYFSLSQNEELCSSMFTQMLDIGFQPYGEIYNMYFLTGAPDFLIALIEGEFLTNPEKEFYLADKETTKKMADAVYKGLLQFLKKRLDF